MTGEANKPPPTTGHSSGANKQQGETLPLYGYCSITMDPKQQSFAWARAKEKADTAAAAEPQIYIIVGSFFVLWIRTRSSGDSSSALGTIAISPGPVALAPSPLLMVQELAQSHSFKCILRL